MRPAGIAKISSIAIRLVNGSGFSNGWALLALKNAAAVGAELPGGLLRGAPAPSADGLPEPFERRHLVIGRQGLDQAPRHQHQGDHEAERQRQVHGAADEIDPEASMVLGPSGPERRVSPRATASATPMPAAAEVKLLPGERPPSARSSSSSTRPRTTCQLVLVVKLAEVLNASAGSTAPSFCGLKGMRGAAGAGSRR